MRSVPAASCARDRPIFSFAPSAKNVGSVHEASAFSPALRCCQPAGSAACPLSARRRLLERPGGLCLASGARKRSRPRRKGGKSPADSEAAPTGSAPQAARRSNQVSEPAAGPLRLSVDVFRQRLGGREGFGMKFGGDLITSVCASARNPVKHGVLDVIEAVFVYMSSAIGNSPT